MGKITVVEDNGQPRQVDAMPGWRVMEIIKAHGFGIEAACGGAGICSTCHVVVDDDWSQRLYPPGYEEQDRLDDLEQARPGSRLSCQIIWSDELDGLSVTLPGE